LIVPCSQCHTRFKVPDHKVTARGTKVRCSRCGHTFRIFPEPAAPAGDPFAAFGPKGTSEMEKTPARGTTVAELLAQMQPRAAADDFDVDDSGEAAPLPEPAWSFPPAPSPRADGAATAVAVDPEEPVTAPMPVSPLPEPGLAEAVVARTHLAELDAVPEPLRSEPSPFGSSADLASLAGFTPAWGVAAPVRALGADGTVSPHQSRLEVPPPPPEPVAPRETIGEALPPEAAGALGPVGTVLDDLPSLEDLPGSSDESLQLDLNPAESTWSGAAPLGHAAAVFELPSGTGSVELDLPAPPPPPPEAAPPPPPAPQAQSSAPASLEWDAPFAPALPAPAPSPPPPAASEFGDPFAEAASSGAGPVPSVPLDDSPPLDPSQERGLFEMGRPGPPSPAVDLGPLLPEIPDSEPAAPPPGSSPTGSISGPFTLGRLSRPPSRTRLGLDDRGEPGAARRVSGFLLNLGIAALLLVVVAALGSGYLSEGRMEWSMLSPRRFFQIFRPPSGVSPSDVTNGTYETRSGRSLLYVRGRVLNRGEPEARVRVEAELWDGGRRVKTSDTVAGASASPEELWMAGTPGEVESLRQKLLAQAHGIASGAGADFLVLFDEVPPELDSLRLRVVTSVDRR
jgi:predicted Zn finger-like uncharacterized protein